MPKIFTRERKDKYMANLRQNLDNCNQVIVISVDNVGSKQIQQIRMALRGMATIVMGKNTRMRRVLREKISENTPELEKLLSLVKKNIGFVFCHDCSLKEAADIIVSYKVPAAAKPGAIAPDDVFVPPGSTGLDPSSTSFFQALNISTKINRGAIEIVSEVHLIQKGDIVTASQSTLLQKLKIQPFFYGVTLANVYDNGITYEASVLNLTNDDVVQFLMDGVQNVTAVSLATGYPALSAVPHHLIEAWQNVLAVGVEGNMDDYFPEVKAINDFLADPSAFAAASGGSSGGGDDKKGGSDDDDSSSSSSSGGMGFDLFG